MADLQEDLAILRERVVAALEGRGADATPSQLFQSAPIACSLSIDLKRQYNLILPSNRLTANSSGLIGPLQDSINCRQRKTRQLSQ